MVIEETKLQIQEKVALEEYSLRKRNVSIADVEKGNDSAIWLFISEIYPIRTFKRVCLCSWRACVSEEKRSKLTVSSGWVSTIPPDTTSLSRGPCILSVVTIWLTYSISSSTPQINPKTEFSIEPLTDLWLTGTKLCRLMKYNDETINKN